MDWLESKGYEFVEKDATKEKDITAVPVTVIGDERIVGFDRPAIKKALKKYE